MRLRAGLVGVMVLALAGCDRLPWQEYHAMEGQYRVELPGRPRVEDHTIKDGGLTYTWFTAVVPLHQGAYLSAWADLPVGIDPDLPRQVQAIADRYKASVNRVEPNQRSGIAGRDFTLATTKPIGQAVGWLGQQKNRLYLLLVLGDPVAPGDSDVQRFLDSFKWIDPLMK